MDAIELHVGPGVIRIEKGLLTSTGYSDLGDLAAIGAQNMLESIVLGHWACGVDVTTPQYLEGLQAAWDGMDNNG